MSQICYRTLHYALQTCYKLCRRYPLCLSMFRPCLCYKCIFYIRNHLLLGTQSSLINLTPKPSLILSSSNREPATTGRAETDVAAPQSLLSTGNSERTAKEPTDVQENQPFFKISYNHASAIFYVVLVKIK